MIFLWTDILIWILVGFVTIFCVYSFRKPQLRQTWSKVFADKIAINSLLILLVYIFIALLDSIHFYNEKQSIKSVLDIILTPMSTLPEKTYSAPFATHSFSKETNKNGSRVYPPLKKPSAHLSANQSAKNDIFIKSAISIISASFLWFLWLKWRTRNSINLTKQNTKYTLLILLIILTFTLYLSQFYHISGTDKVGQDTLYQAIKSIRTGIVIGTLTTLIMLPFAVIFGMLAGFLRGWVDDIIQYLYTTIGSIPGVLLISASILMVQVYISNHPDTFVSVNEQADLRLLSLCIILGITSWTGLCRIIRSEVLKIRESEFVLAAKTMNVGTFRIMVRHLLPNLMHLILISIVLDFSGLVLAEAVLSYIGIGVDPNFYSWGNMINSARMEMAREPVIWWSLVSAFSFMFILVLSANLFADVVREKFDPRMAG